MLTSLTIDYTHPASAKPSVHWGSLFHGILMKNLPPEIATELHKIATRPYAQYVEPIQRSKVRWHIGIWDQEISPQILNAALGQKHVELSRRGIVLPVAAAKQESVPIQTFIARYLTEQEAVHRYELRLITPCTHKSGGQCTMFPSMELIYQNLAKRFSAFGGHFNLYDPEVISRLAANTKITRYSLKSAPYYMEGAQIIGYTGYLCVMISGPETLVRLGGLLLSLANFTGIGIKTAMGMGGCMVEPMISH